MKIPPRAITVLSTALSIDNEGNVKITETLGQKDYKDVNAVLVELGGKWNRKAKAHVFEGLSGAEVQERLDRALDTGEVTTSKELGWFPTPDALADEIASKIENLQPGQTILEPSAGEGALALAVLRRCPTAKILCVEIDPGRVKRLRDAGLKAVTEGNFLEIDPTAVDVQVDHVIMNPPFSPGRADLAHVEHALRFLRPGGELVAIMAAGILFRMDRRTKDFCDKTQRWGTLHALPEGSFRSSGTAVNTAVLHMTKPR